MNEGIFAKQIEIEFNKPHIITRCQYFIKKELEKSAFGLGKTYLTNAPISFYVIKVQSATHTYEFVKETLKIKVTDKEFNESYYSDENFEFKADKNCQYIIPKRQFIISDIFGLDDIERDAKNELNINKNQCVILYGPDGFGKCTLMKKLSNIMIEKKFIWLDYDRLTDEKEYIEILSRNLQTPGYKFVLCIGDYETVQSTAELSLFQREIMKLLDNSNIDLKVLIRISDIELLNSAELLKRSKRILVKIIDRKARFDFINYLIRERTGRETVEDGLEEFSNLLSNISAADVKMFIRRVHSEFPDLTVEQLKSCRKNTEFIPRDLLKSVTDSERLHWEDIGGYDDIKNQLKWSIEIPLKACRVPTKGVLLYGPPGCSKTMFVRALATECSLNLFVIKPMTILRGYVGESEKLLREILLRVRASAPSILFIDEIDTIFPDGLVDSPVTQRLLSELLTFLDGIEKNPEIIFVAATNYQERLDDALIRDGRINLRIPVNLPDQIAREAILKIVFSEENFLVNREIYENLSKIALSLEGKSGADIVEFGRTIKYLARFDLPEELQFVSTEINIDFSHVERCLEKLSLQFSPIFPSVHIHII